MKSCIYLIPNHIQFNKEKVPDFHLFSKDNSSLLYSTLVINNKEVLSNLNSQYSIKHFFDNEDKDYLPEEFSQETEVVFIDTSDKNLMIRLIAEKYFSECKNNFLIFSNLIGLTLSDIHKSINLLSIEDDAVIAGKSSNNSIVFLGFNYYNNLLKEFNFNDNNYDSFLKAACKFENYIYSLYNFIAVNDIEDFKLLYNELSKKESLNYCSQQMHERFTNLFIEYKDLLK